MHSIRQRLIKWALTRFLHHARRALLRDPSPQRIRRDMARFERRMGRGNAPPLVAPVDLGTCTASWLGQAGPGQGPVVLYLHGGAFVAESPEVHCAMLGRICSRAAASAFYVAYRLAPEHPYPAATDDCLAAYRHLLGLGIPASRIVIAGDSAGGNLTAVTALRARDARLPLPAALVMLSPVLDATFSGDSIRRNDGQDPLFRSAIVHRLADCYVPAERRRDPYVSPLFGDLKGLPPALVMVGSSEILLDDAVRFAGRTGNTTLQVWHDLPHVFQLVDALDESGQAIESIAAFIRLHAAPHAAGISDPAAATG